MDALPHFHPIPKVFWQFETDGPFHRCSICSVDLMQPDTNYLIEKAFQNGETVFEYAMCFDCYQKLSQELSADSKKRIQHYFEEHIVIESRRHAMLANREKPAEHWLSECLVKGTPIDACPEYQIYGWCIDRDLVYTGFPYMLSGAVIDDLLQLLSPETRGVLDSLSDQLFGIDMPNPVLLI